MNAYIKVTIAIFVFALYSVVNADTGEVHGGFINVYDNNSGLFVSNGSENI